MTVRELANMGIHERRCRFRCESLMSEPLTIVLSVEVELTVSATICTGKAKVQLRRVDRISPTISSGGWAQ